MRRELLTEWRGAEEPADLRANTHRADEFLARILRTGGLDAGVNEEEVKAAWLAMAGDFVARHAEPASVKDGVLILKVTQPAMRFHLEQMKPVLLKRIQEHLGRGKIKSVKFILG